jgi:hypothetical protein
LPKKARLAPKYAYSPTQILSARMDPILLSIIQNYNRNPTENGDGLDAEVGGFTNRIIMSKKEDISFYLRMIVNRLDGEFHLL